MFYAFEQPSARLRRASTPLLEEEGNPLALTEIPDLENPLRVERTGTRAAFPTDDDPGNTSDVYVAYRP